MISIYITTQFKRNKLLKTVSTICLTTLIDDNCFNFSLDE